MVYTIAALEAELPSSGMSELVTAILATSLRSIGVLAVGADQLADLSPNKHPAPHLQRWLDRSVRHLEERGIVGVDGRFRQEARPLADLWAEWAETVSRWACNPNREARSSLLEACLRGLPGVLTGETLPTDVLFPDSSLHLVEGIYRGNPQADHFNEVLAGTLSAAIEERLRTSPNDRFRIVEIGAGTGGTTAALLPVVQRYPIDEYCYTDVSRAFLSHAEKQFTSECPVLTTALFDVSRPLEEQSIPANHFDFAVAANVLHATTDIRETVRNAKAALKNRGVLLLNEISTWSLTNHLTFGLLEGWWLYEDAPVRIPGCPGLSPERWREILTTDGFESIVFPAEETHRFGQQIVAAVSDGWTRQRMASKRQPRSAATVDGEPPTGSGAVALRPAAPAGGVEPRAAEQARKVIVEKLSEALRMDPGAIRDDAPFADFGVDSIIGVNLVRTINEALGIELETTSLFEYSTVEELSQYVLKNWRDQIGQLVAQVGVGPQAAESAPAATARAAEKPWAGVTRFGAARSAFDLDERDERGASCTDPIAIVGMSGRFAESESLGAFWQHLVDGVDLVREVSRWSAEECAMPGEAGHGYCSRGSFIDSIDRFDASFFGISELEATYMDPQQRLFLEESWKALEDAGYAGKGVHEKQCGVYVGCGSSNYDDLSTGTPPPQAFSGNSGSVIPARIAYLLNLQGPAIAVDTACSSALVAIHLACQGLRSREMEMVVAGGVFLQATPGFYRVANRSGMLSVEGKCYSFDARANGFVPGEGVGVVVLKRLRDALAHGDHIHGVIAGSGINQDGRSNGLTAPNGRAQERLERSVYDRFGIDPETIQVVEAHGTGTVVGDSIEYSALSRAFREYTERKQFCAIGSVKTNIGHAATASGMAGLLKLLLSLKHRQIPPSLNFEKGNPSIDFESGPFYVNTQLKEWTVDDRQIRRAAVSALGFSGTNAHFVLEEPPTADRAVVVAPGYLVAMSGRTGGQLRQQVQNLLGMLQTTPGLSMNDMSFSLLVGRTHFAHRLACVARDQEELVQRLEGWLETPAASMVYASEVRESGKREQASLTRLGNRCIQECRTASSPEYLENLAAIADLYAQGYGLDFLALFARESRRVPLPTYPFARERYWVDAGNGPASRSERPASARLHPLLHANTSTLGQHSYSCKLAGTEPFLEDHPLGADGSGGQRLLGEGSYVEMARAAIERAVGAPLGSCSMELRDVVWTDPLVVRGGKEIAISLSQEEDDQITWEISSIESDRETIHCQGRAILIDEPAPGRVNLDGVRRDFGRGQTEGDGEVRELPDDDEYRSRRHGVIRGLSRKDGQLLAHLDLPSRPVANVNGGFDRGFLLHPKLVAGAIHAGGLLVGNSGAAGAPRGVGRLRILSPCTEKMFVWARHADGPRSEDGPIEVDADLLDKDGNVCVQMLRLSFGVGGSRTDATARGAWVFSRERTRNGDVERADPSDAVEKMSLFLRQAIALQLHSELEVIPTDQSYFDLGLTSLGMAELVQSTCALLGENLLPSVLFEHRDVESLSAHLAATYRASVDAVIVKRVATECDAGERPPATPAGITPFPRGTRASGLAAGASRVSTACTSAKANLGVEAILERVSWQEVPVEDGYEKVTF